MGVPILLNISKMIRILTRRMCRCFTRPWRCYVRKLADILKTPIAIIDKRRPRPNVAEVMNIVGEIEGRTAIIIDDIIAAGTITLAAQALKDKGAKEVYACCTHPVLSGPAKERIENSAIKN